ncbi:DUF2218 domain-containing protein [Streptomyces caelestis]|uniref:DUF2218 domain-containing protein n=1 Tax=Streptomyces caelestis TaxID=36816 RepID=UPI0037FDDDC3
MTTHETTLRSHADVPTARAERWRKQLASHLGRKCEVVRDGDTITLLLAGGSCAMTYDATTLRLDAGGPDQDTLAQVQHVIGVHLERFASEEGLRVAWHRAETALRSYTGAPTRRANAAIPELHRQVAGGEEGPVGLAHRLQLTAQQLAAHRPNGEDTGQR